jgi:type IV pilus assembly protein PilC
MPLFKTKLDTDDRTLLLRQLALLCGNGLSQDQAIHRLAEHNESERVRSYCRSRLENSDRRQAPMELFDPMITAVLDRCSESAEMASVVAEGLHDLADVNETTAQYDKSLKSALVYPVAVFSIFIVVLALILIFVIPVFEDVFSGLGSRLPDFTRTVLAISRWFKTYGVFVASGIVGMLLLFKKRPGCQLLYAWAVPGLGKVMKDVAAIHFSQLFAVMLRFGLPLDGAFQIAAQSVSQTTYGVRLARNTARVTDLTSLKETMKASGIFAESITGVLAFVEQTDVLPKIFADFSTFLRKGFDAQLKKTYKQIEVAAFLLTAICIGGAVVAMYLPIFRMAGALG